MSVRKSLQDLTLLELTRNLAFGEGVISFGVRTISDPALMLEFRRQLVEDQYHPKTSRQFDGASRFIDREIRQALRDPECLQSQVDRWQGLLPPQDPSTMIEGRSFADDRESRK